MSAVHAVVIGVDRHDPSWGVDCGRIPDLAGAVSDALRMKEYLRDGPFALPEARIRTLLSPSPVSDVPQPAVEDLATYANIVQALTGLATTAERGDQVLIHFSGHGMRVPSRETLKGSQGWDEALVPCDAGSAAGGVVRDVELLPRALAPRRGGVVRDGDPRCLPLRQRDPRHPRRHAGERGPARGAGAHARRAER